MRKRFVTFPLFLLFVLLLTLSASATAELGRVEIANRSDADSAFSCDVKLSGERIKGNVFAVLFAESGRMKRVSEYPAAETVQVALQDVVATDSVKILWTDENQMPLANPAVLKMGGNNAAAYEQFAQDLTVLKELEPPVFSQSSEPYALERLIVSADALPDLSGYDVHTFAGPDNLYILQFKKTGEAERCEKELKSSHSVRYAEPDLIVIGNGDMTASDAGSGKSSAPHSWGVTETGIGAYAESLLKREINSPVTVAVVDSGVELNHPFMKNRLVDGYDFIDNDNIPQDGNGHGTHVAGTVVDCTPGMNVKIMPIRVLDNGAGGTLSSILLGIRYAADSGVNVINLSLSLRNHSDVIEDAIQDAISKNITVVVAAGNQIDNAAFHCPAHIRDAITVAAVDRNLKRFELSNYGGLVDLAAPGVAVNSSLPGGKYGEMSGTSMAAPHVSAAAALLISELGAGQTPSQISTAIRDSARTIPKDAGDFEWQRYDEDDFLGAGFLDMRAFIQEPESQFYAHLYADGEMAFQTSQTPNPDKTLVQTYPVSAAVGAGEYAAWHSRRSEIRTVTFIDSVRPNSTALWFYSCENLTDVRGLENLDVSEVTDMSQMFSRCGSLTKLDLSALHTENVRNMRLMFFSCGKLAELDLTGWNTANVADMSDIFNGCTALKTVYASESFMTDNVLNSVGMFSGCTSLVGGSGTEYAPTHTDKAYAHIDGGMSAPGYFTDRDAPTGVYAILYNDGEFVFQYGNTPESGRTVTKTYEVDLDAVYTSYYGAPSTPWYNKREAIRVVNFVDKINPGATAYWFYNCNNLERVDNIQNLDTTNATDMRAMFFNCSKLTTLDVSNFNTANVTSMSSMFSYCSGLTALDVSHFDTANVTNMSWMFRDCSKLTVLDVSRFDTANVTDISRMFAYCSGLTALDVSQFDTAKVTSMSWMFAYCSGLTALDVSHFDTANVTSMFYMFRNCSGLTALDVSKFDTANVTDMNDMFCDCGGLTALDVSKFDTANVTDMGGMFAGCSGLTALDVSQFDTANVNDMQRMFAVCSGLAALDVSQFDTAKVKSMERMFVGCSKLTTLDVSRFNTANVTNMSRMFDDCSGLTALDLSHFDTANVTNMFHMFEGCSGMITLDLSHFDTTNVMRIPSMFHGCSKLKTIYASDKFTTASVPETTFDNSQNMFQGCTSLVGGNGTKYDSEHVDKEYARIDGGMSAPGYFTDKNASSVYAILYSDGELVFQNGNTPKSGKTVTKTYEVDLNAVYDYPNYAPWYNERESVRIVDFMDKISPAATTYWFYFCGKLERLDNLQNLDTSNVTDMGSMFYGCSGLATLDVSKFNTANVTSMTSMFRGCSGLTVLDVSHFNTANVTTMEFMFEDCGGLTELNVSHFDTANVIEMDNMFDGCSGLTTLDVSHFNTANVTDMEYMFDGCSSLTTLDVSKFNTANVTFTRSMFRGCSGLTALDVSHFDTANVMNMESMFYGCSGLTALDVSKFNTVKVEYINHMFRNCSSLTTLDISSFDTANVKRAVGMFSFCSNLKTIYASDKFTTESVPEIGLDTSRNMFNGCMSLVGGNGTKYDSEHVDKEYARIDGGTDNPGYFTRKS